MEGRERLGRVSSRYGPTATTVFNGPVRKWKKNWVHVARSQPSARRYDHPAQSNGHNTLLLRRWTPTTLPSDDGAPAEDPPRRKFRYTPIAVLEERRKEVEKKAKDEAKLSLTDQFPISQASPSDDVEENYSNMDEDDDNNNSNGEAEDDGDDNDLNNGTTGTEKNEARGWSSNVGGLDLELDLKGSEDNNDDIVDENKEAETQIANV